MFEKNLHFCCCCCCWILFVDLIHKHISVGCFNSIILFWFRIKLQSNYFDRFNMRGIYLFIYLFNFSFKDWLNQLIGYFNCCHKIVIYSIYAAKCTPLVIQAYSWFIALIIEPSIVLLLLFSVSFLDAPDILWTFIYHLNSPCAHFTMQ